MRRPLHLRRGLWATALATVLVLSTQSSQADEWYPGLPDPDGTSSWANVAQGGMAYADKARQFVRVPDAMVTSTQIVKTTQESATRSRYTVDALAYFVSPVGAPAPYGYLAPMTIRTVGFGLMPVEATVQVSQRRENGYPVPVAVDLDSVYRKDPDTLKTIDYVAQPTRVEDRFDVRILDAKVDGISLGLTGECRTVEPALMSMVGPGYTIDDPYRYTQYAEDWYAGTDPATFFHPIFGGQLRGTLTLPAFTGCTTATGDDLSGLMTKAVSGGDTEVTAQVLGPCSKKVPGDAAEWPLAVGENTPATSGCPARPQLPYPPRPPF